MGVWLGQKNKRKEKKNKRIMRFAYLMNLTRLTRLHEKAIAVEDKSISAASGLIRLKYQMYHFSRLFLNIVIGEE